MSSKHRQPTKASSNALRKTADEHRLFGVKVFLSVIFMAVATKLHGAELMGVASESCETYRQSHHGASAGECTKDVLRLISFYSGVAGAAWSACIWLSSSPRSSRPSPTHKVPASTRAVSPSEKSNLAEKDGARGKSIVVEKARA